MSLRQALARTATHRTDFLDRAKPKVDDYRGLREHFEERVPEAVRQVAPSHLDIVGSVGKGVRTYVPWVALLDPGETTSAQRGIYPVYLFDAQLETVTLSLNQGVTELAREHGRGPARDHLTATAVQIRKNPEAVALIEGHTRAVTTLDLLLESNGRGTNAALFEPGHALGFRYDLSALPAETELVDDLRTVVNLYDIILGSLAREPRATGSTGDTGRAAPPPREPESTDKPDGQIERLTEGHTVIIDRLHERVQNAYRQFLEDRGIATQTNVWPRDLVVQVKGLPETLVEVKRVYTDKEADAVDEVVGQLHRYTWIFYRDERPQWLAVLTKQISADWVEYLNSLGIGCAWPDSHGGFSGCNLAQTMGLADSLRSGTAADVRR